MCSTRWTGFASAIHEQRSVTMITYYNPLGGVSLTNEYFAGLVGEAAQH